MKYFFNFLLATAFLSQILTSCSKDVLKSRELEFKEKFTINTSTFYGPIDKISTDLVLMSPLAYDPKSNPADADNYPLIVEESTPTMHLKPNVEYTNLFIAYTATIKKSANIKTKNIIDEIKDTELPVGKRITVIYNGTIQESGPYNDLVKSGIIDPIKPNDKVYAIFIAKNLTSKAINLDLDYRSTMDIEYVYADELDPEISKERIEIKGNNLKAIVGSFKFKDLGDITIDCDISKKDKDYAQIKKTYKDWGTFLKALPLGE